MIWNCLIRQGNRIQLEPDWINLNLWSFSRVIVINQSKLDRGEVPMDYIYRYSASAHEFKMSASANSSLLCVFCRKYLVDSPRQAPCGERLCGACFKELRQRLGNYSIAAHTNLVMFQTTWLIFCSDQQDVTCPDCHQQIILAKVK